jgi:ABC-type antimicrobial peptide transport system permease subunit
MKTMDRMEGVSRTVERSSSAQGVQDVSGLGFLGLVVGILAGFLASFYWIIPLFPKDKAIGNLTVMTIVVVAAMTIGGAIGYLATRRRA